MREKLFIGEKEFYIEYTLYEVGIKWKSENTAVTPEWQLNHNNTPQHIMYF